MAHRMLVFLFVLGMLISSCGFNDTRDPSFVTDSCTLHEEDRRTIHAMREGHEREALAGDWDTMSQSYSQDVIVMFPNRSDIVGRDELVAFQRTFPAVTEVEYTFAEVGGCGDLAYVTGHYSIAMDPGVGSEAIRDMGRWIWILRKQPDGRWLVTRDISNSNQPVGAQ
jgi:ketosteroid isomerase-like protein